MFFADAAAADARRFSERLTRATAVDAGITGPTAVVIPMLPTRAASTALGRLQGMHASSGRLHHPYLLTTASE